MPDPRVEAVARVLAHYSVDVQPGQLVQIDAQTEAAPLVVALYRAILDRGAHPYVQLGLEETQELFYRFASDAQIDYIPDFVARSYDEIDARIAVWSDANTKRLSTIDPARQARRSKAYHPLRNRELERMMAGEVRWVGTAFPTHAAAQTAEVSLREYENFVYDACLVDKPDPIAAWKEISRRQAKLIDWLTPHKVIRVEGPDTDLTLSVAGRTWVNCDGRENFPDGEIFTGPVEDSVNGHIRFSFPACYHTRQVEDVHLWFESGKVVKATAAKNEAFLHEMLDVDEGARFVGEFAFGLNQGIQRFTGDTLFDEKIGGTIHLALGKGFEETGSSNDSAIHWDMVTDLRQEGRVLVDGEPFFENGRFSIEA